jgi:nucleotide-binding universal stress UspA family protein
MTTPTSPARDLRLVVGYDGSPPASRALDTAVALLQGRTGSIDVVYIAHLSTAVMMSAGAVAEMETSFDEIEEELRVAVAEQLRPHELSWEFHRRQGPIAEELIAVAENTRTAHHGDTVVILVGSSSSAAHRVVGSAAVSLARHSPVPLIVVP